MKAWLERLILRWTGFKRVPQHDWLEWQDEELGRGSHWQFRRCEICGYREIQDNRDRYYDGTPSCYRHVVGEPQYPRAGAGTGGVGYTVTYHEGLPPAQ